MKLSKAVMSSAIKTIGYDTHEKEMWITFNHGGTYSYPEVPFKEFKAFAKADSIGKYYHNRIKGRYGV